MFGRVRLATLGSLTVGPIGISVEWPIDVDV